MFILKFSYNSTHLKVKFCNVKFVRFVIVSEKKGMRNTLSIFITPRLSKILAAEKPANVMKPFKTVTIF